MQTAVNWMIDELIKKHVGKVGNEYVEIFEQAKQLEKQQIIDAHIDGQPIYSCQSEKAEEYYNEQFKKN